MNTSHTLRLCAAALTVLSMTGCAATVEQPVRQLSWSDLRPIVTEATTSVGRHFGDGWSSRPVENPVGTCVTTEGDFDDQSMIPESSGTAEVWVGRVPATAAPSERGRILRDRFETPWRDLGFDTRYEPSSPVAPGGRVVATLDRSQQLILTGSLEDGAWTLVARVACSTAGLPGSFTARATPVPGPASATEKPEAAPQSTAPSQ